ncbi:hypothetical protein KP509_02G027500 [Ceratopteris richardii]|nr:hypothetical protein KP509_02G027500 [Ceratopteris richardii]KAH7443260.1 hypothetical protein KP509_02G027500 [Ceratopteris richardii]KAH7443264.1 hypothetical protein KP509_02G027500 [Ceratopteris richardii]
MGEGTFGQVLECWDRDSHEAVAIKVIRSEKKYREAAKYEIDILFKIGNDRAGARSCVQMKRWFEYEDHICIVFEKLGPSLYDFLKTNSDRPFTFKLVREFARQILESVAYMHNLKYIHTDLKPENVLLTSSECRKFVVPVLEGSSKRLKELRVPRCSRVKLIDFGSATSYKQRSASSIVSTRHYRAPEVILGLGWSYPCDIWSIGCMLAELSTGVLLFDTHEDLEHLAMMERILGRIPSHLIKNVTGKAEEYFRHRRRLNWPEGASSSRSVRAVQRVLQLDELLEKYADDYENSFLDLLRQLLKYDPNDRPTAEEALGHPFFRGH